MKPKTRLDNFLAKIAKDPEADTSMEPESRKEYYLNKIAENSGSGGRFIIECERQDGSALVEVKCTSAEISEAFNAGKQLLVHFDSILQLQDVYFAYSASMSHFSNPSSRDGTAYMFMTDIPSVDQSGAIHLLIYAVGIVAPDNDSPTGTFMIPD